MIDFKRITIEDKEWVKDLLKKSDFRGSEYSFVNQFLWGELVDMKIAKVGEMLCTLYERPTKNMHDFPVGDGDTVGAIEAILNFDAEAGKESLFRGILHEEKEWLEVNMPGRFSFENIRDDWDYIYKREDLAEIKGKKYHGKRNHIARFKSNNDWEYEVMTPETLDESMMMYVDWLNQNADRLDDSIEAEKTVMQRAFLYFKELGLEGGILRSEGKIVGFCVGEPLNSDTYIVHLEKAYTEIQGAYPMLNQQFVLHNMENFTYVNREDDLGLEGLRKAKLSYHPEILLEKYQAVLCK